MSAFPQRPFLGGRQVAPRSSFEQRFVLNAPYVHGRVRPAPTPMVEELPSIDEFLDRTPPIEQFAPAHVEMRVESERASEWSWGGEAAAAPIPASEPPTGDWAAFDWGSAASLGSAPPDAAAEAWASTDWSEPADSKESRQSAAEALARALDQISRRIRAGELRVPGPETVQDDAAIAATLAALLGIRR